MKILNKKEYKVPIFSWCPKIENNALKQVETMTQLPFLHKRICIMPDGHLNWE